MKTKLVLDCEERDIVEDFLGIVDHISDITGKSVYDICEYLINNSTRRPDYIRIFDGAIDLDLSADIDE